MYPESARSLSLDQRPEIQRAKELAGLYADQSRQALVADELHVLLGILDVEGTRTRRELLERLGPDGFHHLREVVTTMLKEGHTPGSAINNA
jgi:hypothetical protein